MKLINLLTQAKPIVEKNIVIPKGDWPTYTLFLSVSDGDTRAHVIHCTGEKLDDVWQQLSEEAEVLISKENIIPKYLRVDWVKAVRVTHLEQLKKWLTDVKRNYFRYGLAFDTDFKTAFLEQELNSNAMLYGGNKYAHVVINQKNFSIYAKKRYPEFNVDFNSDATIYMLDTEGVFCSEDEPCKRLYPKGREAGRRVIDKITKKDALGLIERSSSYLATQVKYTGQFYYGWHPCFDRYINTYNTLRHASTTYSMVEAWEVTKDPELEKAILRSIDYIVNVLIHRVTLKEQSKDIAFLVEHNGKEVKLGANAVCILALSKYSEVTGSKEYLELLEQLALGIEYMQNKKTGKFVHVLNYPELTVKDEFRVIYYDGEAAFGLMRLYGLTKDARWLTIVEKAFDYFIEAEHWKAHDHWLSYCVNELTLYREDERYYKFGLQNVIGYLDFIANRITTFPTLLELMMAAERMITRLQSSPEYQYLLKDVNLEEFYFALEKRAHYLLNGHFWPEYAMYFAKPNKILGSFFIRHHSFRVRIDDVEHYLSGFIAYLKYLIKNKINNTKKTKERIIGFLSYPASPINFKEVNALAKVAWGKNVTLFYMSYKNIEIKGGFVNGFLYEEGRWKKETKKIPLIIDNAPSNTIQQKKIESELKKYSHCIYNKIGGKKKTFNILKEKKETADLLISSSNLSFDNVIKMISQHEKIIVKPFRGNRGRGVYLIEKSDELFFIKTDMETLSLSRLELKSWCKNKLSQTWMIQKYIASITNDKEPFDIRVPIFRGKSGEWNIADIYARIGQGEVTSNLATGGRAVPIGKFISKHLSKGEGTLLETLKDNSYAIANAIQESYDFDVDALGCDFGLHGNKLYLFEVNAYPGIKGCLSSAVEIKTEYYLYSLDKQNNG